MERLLIGDPTLPVKLQQAATPIELVDAEGRVVGYFMPRPTPAQYEGLECPLSREELEKRKQQKNQKTYTTAEVLAYLANLSGENR